MILGAGSRSRCRGAGAWRGASGGGYLAPGGIGLASRQGGRAMRLRGIVLEM